MNFLFARFSEPEDRPICHLQLPCLLDNCWYLPLYATNPITFVPEIWRSINKRGERIKKSVVVLFIHPVSLASVRAGQQPIAMWIRAKCLAHKQSEEEEQDRSLCAANWLKLWITIRVWSHVHLNMRVSHFYHVGGLCLTNVSSGSLVQVSAEAVERVGVVYWDMK